MKQNCWKYKRCGREPGSSKAERLGLCAAATETRLDGVHEGTNGGRACWVVAGTVCGGGIQGTHAQKIGKCEKCGFVKKVVAEEYPNHTSTEDLLKKLR